MDWAGLPAELLKLCYAYTEQVRLAGESSALKDRCQSATGPRHMPHVYMPLRAFLCTLANRLATSWWRKPRSTVSH